MKISIKTNLLAVFITIVVVISFSLLLSHFHYSKKIALESTAKNFKYLSKEVSHYLESQHKHINKILSILSNKKDIAEPITLSPFQNIFHSFTDIMKLENSIHSIYYTDNNNSFYEIIHIQKNLHYHKKYNLQDSAVWLIINVVNNIQQFTYLDEELKIIEKIDTQNNYKWQKKEWYLNALKTTKMVISDPYLFSHLKQKGITYSKRILNHSIVSIDYTLQSVKELLLSQQFSNNIKEIYILNKKAVLLTTTLDDKKKITIPYTIHNLDKIIYKEVQNKGIYEILFQLQGSKNYIGSRIDADKLLEPYIQNFKYSFFIALLLIIIFIPIIIYSIKLIIRPIDKLILENNKIKNRNFDSVAPIHSNILEFNELSKSLVDMSMSIKEYQASQSELLDAIIKLIAEAIDAKSPYTAGHCRRVPEIAKSLLDAVNNSTNTQFKDFRLTTKDEIKEFEIGAWLHDCGKVTTPEYVVDKSTKLETIYNRIHEIRMRFEVLLRDSIIEELHGNISKEEQENIAKQLQDDFKFIAQMNLGTEFMSQESINKVIQIAQRQWKRYFDDRLGLSSIELTRFTTDSKHLPSVEYLLSDKEQHIIPRENFDYEAYKKDGFKESVPKYLYNYGEIYNLCITKGTLCDEERYKINEHVIMSIKMLEKIPFPKGFTKIPEYAGTHHETLIGTGYPRKLTKEKLSIPARIMSIADIFEALSASDRPYKEAKTLSQTLKIMAFMAQEEQIDRDLYRLFLEKKVYMFYAKKYLKVQQLDKVNIEELLTII